MGTSLAPNFKNELAERLGAGRSTMSGHRSAGAPDRVCLVKELSGELGVKGRHKPTLNRASQGHYLFEVRKQEETGTLRKLLNLANVLGVAQPAALQMSASEAERASNQDDATPQWSEHAT